VEYKVNDEVLVRFPWTSADVAPLTGVVIEVLAPGRYTVEIDGSPLYVNSEEMAPADTWVEFSEGEAVTVSLPWYNHGEESDGVIIRESQEFQGHFLVRLSAGTLPVPAPCIVRKTEKTSPKGMPIIGYSYLIQLLRQEGSYEPPEPVCFGIAQSEEDAKRLQEEWESKTLNSEYVEVDKVPIYGGESV
jgi:hypothetical protein